MTAKQKTKPKKLISMQRHWFNGLVCNHQKFWKKLGDFENKVLEFDLEPIEIDRPVYVCGLARSGSTILLEFLASHPDFVSHKYSDFPFVFTPYLWRSIQKFMRIGASKEEERFHGDGLMVNSDSPEAMEEILWMHFYKGMHQNEEPKLLSDLQVKDGFESFYMHHIRKLIFQAKAKRYLAKGNYNVGRIDKILSMMDDALFLVPIRHSIAHVESLMRQHQNFLEKTGDDKRALKHLQRVGHFEFGADLRPLYLGDPDGFKEILALFDSGEVLRGYARYWAYVYRYLYQHYADNKSVFCYRYEDFCENTAVKLSEIADFVGTNFDANVLSAWANKIKAPDYYQSKLNEEEKAMIIEETQEVLGLWGYN